jgi:CRISPR-associated protein Csy1
VIHNHDRGGGTQAGRPQAHSLRAPVAATRFITTMTQNTAIDQIFRRAQAALQAGRRGEAKQLLAALLVQAPGHPDALHQMGVIARADKNPALSVDYLRRALAADDRRPDLWLNLALTQEDLGDPAAALDSLGRAVALRPDFAEAWNNMGLLRRDLKRAADAEQAFRNAIRFRPGYGRAYNNLGILLREQNRREEAQQYFEQAARLQPGDLAANFNAGMNLQSLRQPGKAEGFFRAVVKLDPKFAAGWEGLGESCRLLGRLEDAEKALCQALALQPAVKAEKLNDLARVLWQQGRADEAVATYARARASEPGNLRAALGAELTLPQIHADAESIGLARQRFSDGLDRLAAQSHLFVSAPRGTILDALAWSNFYLAYHGEDDRLLQARYAAFVHSILERTVPELLVPAQAASAAAGRIRVGFISGQFTNCTVGNYFKRWISALDRERFETHVFHLSARDDAVTGEIAGAAAQFHSSAIRNAAVLDIAHYVRQQDLDVLVYPELGMDPVCFLLAAMRLAPVQCAAWGHPVTSGHGSIDYYLSCAAMEPEDARDHYTETLVLLPGLGTHYDRLAVPAPGTRAEVGLPEDKHLYLCQQSLFKIHPDNDDLLVALVARDPAAVLVFFAARQQAMTSQFLDRIGRAFDRAGVSSSGRVVVLERVGHTDYLRISQLCDVMLDTLHWSGGNSSLDALACGLPVVTLPGRFMRGRQTRGMLTEMGVTELIAADRDGFLDIALRIACDQAYRSALSEKIRARLPLIFGRDEPIRALESFLLDAAPGTASRACPSARFARPCA